MDLLKTFGPLVSSVAPTIATALGGPVAGMAVKALSNALLGHADGTEDEINAALANPTADQLAALKKIDADFKVQMKSLDIDLERIAASDRDSARNYAIMTHDLTPRVLAVIVVVAWGCVQWFMLHNVIESSMRELIARVLGTLDGALMLVLSYYFGSAHRHTDGK
ncbi:hypothetical protein EBT25_11895 [bacterium]|jgi:hypothetical protein|nr:hypothetical protein [bacterium]